MSVRTANNTYNVNVTVMSAPKGTTNRSMLSVVSALEKDAVAAGASNISIKGSLMSNGKFTEVIANRLGYSFNRIDEHTVMFSRGLNVK